MFIIFLYVVFSYVVEEMITLSRIAEVVARKVSDYFFSNQFVIMTKEVETLKNTLNSISSMDDFAKWARTQRELENSTQKLSDLENQKNTFKLKSGMKISLGLKIFLWLSYLAFPCFLFSLVWIFNIQDFLISKRTFKFCWFHILVFNLQIFNKTISMILTNWFIPVARQSSFQPILFIKWRF
jgi:hypothetical protein